MKVRFICVGIILMLVLSAAALCAAGDRAKAGPAGKMWMNRERGQMGAGARVKAFCKALQLDETACAKVGEIVKAYNQSLAAVIQDKNITPEEKRSKFQAIRSKTESDILALLSPEQKEKAKNGRLIMRLLNPMRGGQGLEWAVEQLDLTESQKAQVQAIMKETEEAVKNIRDDASLTQEQKRQKLQEIRKSSHERIMNVLTPEQREKLKQLMENAKERIRKGMEQNKGGNKSRRGAGQGGSGGGQI